MYTILSASIADEHSRTLRRDADNFRHSVAREARVHRLPRLCLRPQRTLRASGHGRGAAQPAA
jgi:hypothetical protein